jgi:hypothetical protein
VGSLTGRLVKSGPIGVFYGYAKSAGWTDVDPVAVGHGTRRRNTFRGRALTHRISERVLTRITPVRGV